MQAQQQDYAAELRAQIESRERQRRQEREHALRQSVTLLQLRQAAPSTVLPAGGGGGSGGGGGVVGVPQPSSTAADCQAPAHSQHKHIPGISELGPGIHETGLAGSPAFPLRQQQARAQQGWGASGPGWHAHPQQQAWPGSEAGVAPPHLPGTEKMHLQAALPTRYQPDWAAPAPAAAASASLERERDTQAGWQAAPALPPLPPLQGPAAGYSAAPSSISCAACSRSQPSPRLQPPYGVDSLQHQQQPAERVPLPLWPSTVVRAPFGNDLQPPALLPVRRLPQGAGPGGLPPPWATLQAAAGAGMSSSSQGCVASCGSSSSGRLAAIGREPDGEAARLAAEKRAAYRADLKRQLQQKEERLRQVICMGLPLSCRRQLLCALSVLLCALLCSS